MAKVLTNEVGGGQITVKHLSVAYKDLVVLENMDIEVRSGEFLCLVGPSGCGKTTLLNALAGFIPASGDINVAGKIGVVFQDHSVFPWMTVAENIAFGLRNGKRGDEAEIVRQHLKLIRLDDKSDKYPAELSGGQIQRVGIARALAPGPDVVLMDEPFGALDRYTRERMQQWLLEVWTERHKTIILVTHDMDEAIFLSDRILVLNAGRVAAEYAVPLGRPRVEEMKFSPEFIQMKKDIYERIKQ
jgi:NitT/TauT family transport system ATP-binding protein